jgi:CRISPR/Cas system-associated protein endoribonuclease Cas2
MNELDNIQNKIYVIRGQRVMLDFDLATIYEVETKALNQAVKRNYKRFEGEEFMFQLSPEEWKIFTNSHSSDSRNTNIVDSLSNDYNLRSQFVTSRFSDKWGGNRRPPYAFTEIGVAMLSSVLRSEVAIQANRKIMKAFVAYRHLAELPLAATYLDLRKQIEDLKNEVNDILADQNDINESTRAQLDAISTALAELQAKPAVDKPRRPIGFIQPKDEEDS